MYDDTPAFYMSNHIFYQIFNYIIDSCRNQFHIQSAVNADNGEKRRDIDNNKYNPEWTHAYLKKNSNYRLTRKQVNLNE